jgi:hypothetical protein
MGATALFARGKNMKKILVSLVLILTASVLSVRSVRADSISIETFTVQGVAPGPSEWISGSFMFDYTTAVAYDFSLAGTGPVSETWNSSDPAAYVGAIGCPAGYGYMVGDYNIVGSLGDPIPFSVLLFTDPSLQSFAEGPGNLTGFKADNWDGIVTATPVPEPATWMLVLAGGLVMLAVKVKLG